MKLNRFAVISDIHGNIDALHAVLGDIDVRGISTIINLGDHLSGPLTARETADLLMSRDMIHIRGNHDRQVVTIAPDDMGASDRVAYEQLDGVHLDWLRSLPTHQQIDDVFLCHGTPSRDDHYWLETVRPDGSVAARFLAEVEQEIQSIDASLFLCGHTHIPRVVTLNDDRMIVNPGSVGLPAYVDDNPVPHIMATGDNTARYAVIEREESAWRIALHAVAYDTTRMVQLAEAANRPDWTDALRYGRISS